MILAAVGYLPLAMLAAGYASHWVNEAGVRARHVVHARLVTAVVLTEAHSTYPMAAVWVPVRWIIGDRTHTGSTPVPYGTRRGVTVQVWVDRSGDITTPPPTTAQLDGQVLAVRMFTPLLVAELIALSLWALRWYLDRQRLARWESEWCLIDPGCRA